MVFFFFDSIEKAFRKHSAAAEKSPSTAVLIHSRADPRSKHSTAAEKSLSPPC